MVLGFPEELNKELLALYLEHCKEIRSILSSTSMDLPHYHNLEWRFDVQLASRSLQRQTQPVIMLRLHTKDGGVYEMDRERESINIYIPSTFTDETKTQLLQIDPANLLHMTQKLEAALAEIKTQHCRRIMRNIK